MEISTVIWAKQTHSSSLKPVRLQHRQCRAVAVRAPLLRVCVLALGCVLFLLGLSLWNLPLVLELPALTGDGAAGVLLLLWWHPFGNYHSPPDCAARYGIHGCTVTADRRAYARADAVLIHHREIRGNLSTLPPEPRPRTQKWIWMNFESPSHTPALWRLEGVFNLTMSYRTGADIFLPYGYLRPRRQGNPGPPRPPRKSALVAWVISNWSEAQARVRFYRRLSRHVSVDVYGRGMLPLEGDSIVHTVARYKFYLAFENSVHPDYITEKLWRNALLAGAVPVVLGPPRENYERFLPADAFIHVDDFRSARALAAYLTHLDAHPALYHRYHAWRRDYNVHVTAFWAEHYCAACRAVQASRHQTKAFPDLAMWFQS